MVNKTAVLPPVRHWFKAEIEFLARPVQIFKEYRAEDLRPNLLAGLTVAVVMLPQAIAYALIADLPPQVGLYAAIEDHFLDCDEAISWMFHKVLEPSVCIYECELRIFAECQALPKWSSGEGIPEAAAFHDFEVPSWPPSELKLHLTA